MRLPHRLIQEKRPTALIQLLEGRSRCLVVRNEIGEDGDYVAGFCQFIEAFVRGDDGEMAHRLVFLLSGRESG